MTSLVDFPLFNRRNDIRILIFYLLFAKVLEWSKIVPWIFWLIRCDKGVSSSYFSTESKGGENDWLNSLKRIGVHRVLRILKESFESLKKRKFLLLNIFFALYIGINLIGGERGLISYFDKKKIFEGLVEKEKTLTNKIKEIDHKISLVKNNDLDFLDMLYREKFRYGTNDEIIIKLKWVENQDIQKK